MWLTLAGLLPASSADAVWELLLPPAALALLPPLGLGATPSDVLLCAGVDPDPDLSFLPSFFPVLINVDPLAAAFLALRFQDYQE